MTFTLASVSTASDQRNQPATSRFFVGETSAPITKPGTKMSVAESLALASRVKSSVAKQAWFLLGPQVLPAAGAVEIVSANFTNSACATPHTKPAPKASLSLTAYATESVGNRISESDSVSMYRSGAGCVEAMPNLFVKPTLSGQMLLPTPCGPTSARPIARLSRAR